MAKKSSTQKSSAGTTGTASSNPFALRSKGDVFAPNPQVHVYGKGHVCSTNERGYPTPKNRSPAEIVLDRSEGFIPLWDKNVTLRWRFNEPSMQYFQDSLAAKSAIRQLWGEAVMLWGDAAPVQFRETDDAWDFELAMQSADRCSISGCTLARAFFPDAGRHELAVYPKMFTQSRKEQVDTFIHEIGHVFGLRHFFADVSETQWASVIFGTHRPFSIMNYGNQSELTEDDKSDLKLLYAKVWGGTLTEINGTRIVKVRPYHDLLH
jgi:hypothetical protein